MNIAIRLDSVSCRYSQQRKDIFALRDISIEIKSGACVLISGPSGSGKSTLLRCMNGIIPHFFPIEYTGRTLIFGEETSRLSLAEIATRVGTVFQNAESQLLTTSVEAEVAFGVENLALPPTECRRRCEWAMRAVGVDHLRGRLIASLSGGEKQRLAIASVLAMQPPILLFDEPLANLDPLSVREFLAQLRILQSMGLTIVIVEQFTKPLLGIAERLLWLEKQRITYDGAPEQPAEGSSQLSVPLVSLSAVCDVPASPVDLSGPLPPNTGGRVPYIQDESCVTFKDVRFQYPHGPIVLRDITLNLYAGQWVSILGRNGIGKTTLVKLINGLLTPSAGRVVVCGMDTSVNRLSELSKKVGYVFQNPLHSLYAVTIEQELSVYPQNQGLRLEEVQDRVKKVLAIFELESRANDSPFILSGGEQQRLAIAAILTGFPRVIILDEPTRGMTQADIVMLLSLIERLKKSGHLLVMITHNLDIVRQCDRVIVLAEGQVLADGEPRGIMTDSLVDTVFAR